MKNSVRFSVVLFCIGLAAQACGSSIPTEVTPQSDATENTQTVVATSTVISTAIPVSSPTPTESRLQLEIVQYQVWTDPYGNLRVNVLFRNPYEYPVGPTARGNVSVFNKDGKLLRNHSLYFLDGISGGHGFLLPGETVAANTCFTCEELPITEEPDSYNFEVLVEDASSKWNYYADVEATIGNVSFEGDSPIFFVSGTVKNNTDQALNRISARVFVYDQEGKIVGVAEASAYDVGHGASGSFNGSGFGDSPDGPVTYEVSALGVKY